MRAAMESPASRETTATGLPLARPHGVLDREVLQGDAVPERQQVAEERGRRPGSPCGRWPGIPDGKSRIVVEHDAVADERGAVRHGEGLVHVVVAGAHEDALARVGGRERGLQLGGRRHDGRSSPQNGRGRPDQGQGEQLS